MRTNNRRPRVYPRYDVDLAAPALQDTQTYSQSSDTHVHPIQQPPSNDATVALIAGVLLAGGSIAAIVAALTPVLAAWKISPKAIEIALGMARNGTNHRPNARLAGLGASLDPTISGGKDAELMYRAAYLANAAKRLQTSLNEGKTPREAITLEWPNFQAHEAARKNRQESMSRAQTMAATLGQKDEHGTLLGWYRSPFSNSETECRLADGNNFYYEDGTKIGYPGSVHPNCHCKAGPPIPGAPLVDDVLGRVVPIRRVRPKFKKHG
ncbi:MAG: hypothetical protein ACM3UO_00255 [Bacillota bacterium]